MKIVIRESLKLVAIAIGVSLLMYIVFGVKFATAITFFLWQFAFLEIPYWIKNGTISVKIKLVLVTLTGLVSFSVFRLLGEENLLLSFMVAYFVLLVGSTILYNFRKKELVEDK